MTADFWATVCKTFRPILYRTVVCLSCLWRWCIVAKCIVAKRLDGSRWNLAYR